MQKTSSLLLACAIIMGALQNAEAQQSSTLTIQTNYPQALVYADSLLLGRASEGTFAVPAATGDIRLVVGSEREWTIPPLVRHVAPLQPDSSYTLQLDFPYYYRVRSMPFGSGVYVVENGTRRRLGDTPLLYTSAAPLRGTLVVDHPEFGAKEVAVGTDIWNDVNVVLKPDGDAQRAVKLSWSPPKYHRRWIDYASVGLAVAAGITSVHFKLKADNLFEDYRETGDPLLRERIESLDTRAGIALGAMQVGVGVFAVRLILRKY
ncbi:MAG TPA: hypothetical protein VFG50_02045 [Rhodothermales bacterium]|nr:hypothetical protein [Rhodothermales bacterium]